MIRIQFLQLHAYPRLPLLLSSTSSYETTPYLLSHNPIPVYPASLLFTAYHISSTRIFNAYIQLIPSIHTPSDHRIIQFSCYFKYPSNSLEHFSSPQSDIHEFTSFPNEEILSASVLMQNRYFVANVRTLSAYSSTILLSPSYNNTLASHPDTQHPFRGYSLACLACPDFYSIIITSTGPLINMLRCQFILTYE